MNGAPYFVYRFSTRQMFANEIEHTCMENMWWKFLCVKLWKMLDYLKEQKNYHQIIRILGAHTLLNRIYIVNTKAKMNVKLIDEQVTDEY